MTPGNPAKATRDLVQTALLAALCAAVGYLFSSLPNVELISATTFACGVWAGPRRGALVGALAEAVYAGFNRYGVSPPPLYAAQILGFAFLGAAGGVLGPMLRRVPGAVAVFLSAASGFACTLAYDLLTNAAIWVMAREQPFVRVVWGGLVFPFPFAHALGNTVAFACVVPAVMRALRHRRAA